MKSKNKSDINTELSQRLDKLEQFVQGGITELKNKINPGTSHEGHNEDIQSIELFESKVMESINAFRKELNAIENRIKLCEIDINQVKEDRMRNMLVLYGLNEKDKENLIPDVVNIFRNKLKITAAPGDFKYCYRIGNKRIDQKKPRPISIVFVNRWFKEEVYRAKKCLKGTPFVLSEMLSTKNRDLFMKVRSVVGSKNCWTLKEVLESLGLVQMIKQPTRITDKTATLIDYALVSNVNLVKEVGTKHVPEVSDHELVFLSLKIGHEQKKISYKTTRNFKNFNYAQFDSDLRSIPWNTIYELDDVDSKIGFLSDSINALLDIHAPFQTFRITKTYAPWLTNSIKAMMKDRDEALSKFKKTKNLQHWKDYKQLRNLVTRIVKHEKKIFCKINIEKNKSTKNMWGNIRKIFHDHDKRDIQLPSNFDNVNLMNDHFVNSIPGSTPDEKIINYYKTNVKDK
ncbi:uncharacterized protein LOC123677920 [Harmonia axyridis]|uniref:uncharacterized protein LOC123677920 n=1 Tax=Harmonia axyridis TaxID=115357 RepID=UPI001E278F03|nr:uncharacterized protein LOC123677920 [Harmonia axyridis]